MMEHVFGGDWTEEKLDKLRGYLVAYRSIFETNAKAKYFTTWYVDAFAGTGSRSASSPSSSQLLDLTDEDGFDDEKAKFLDGSAKIALSIRSPFDKYLFIEESKKKADALAAMVAQDFPALLDRVEIRVQDGNKALCEWCQSRNWKTERAVVFLDPYGMQVQWKTIETLASTKAIDLWYLFPFVTRLLRIDQNIDDSWSNKLDSLFGTSDWFSRFYTLKTQETLFGSVENTVRDATVSNVQSYIEERLKTCFVAVAKSRVLRNSRSSPLFALCFAASNEKGAQTALKIAQHLLET